MAEAFGRCQKCLEGTGSDGRQEESFETIGYVQRAMEVFRGWWVRCDDAGSVVRAGGDRAVQALRNLKAIAAFGLNSRFWMQ